MISSKLTAVSPLGVSRGVMIRYTSGIRYTVGNPHSDNARNRLLLAIWYLRRMRTLDCY